ncbi:hypothetical protein CHISP_2896 [Chitinispirillum alkaliphilum]|nr:hypothetical protein CHISP_2896 [Chitinispirillum alkaliphilum]
MYAGSMLNGCISSPLHKGIRLFLQIFGKQHRHKAGPFVNIAI